MNFWRIIAAGTIAASLTGCDTTRSLQQLRHVAMKGTPFQHALAEEYRRFAESELKAYDWWSSKYFADKGMIVAYGKDVPPEQVADWDVDANSRDALLKARSELVAKLSPDYVQAQPEAAAKMQAYFDCWVEQADEGDAEDRDTCRLRFDMLMGRYAPQQVQAQSSPQVEVAAAPASAMGGPLSTSYMLNFDWDSSMLAGMARDELAELASGLLHHGSAYQVVINGHADRSGDDDYNMQLSQERADEVRDFLMQHGIPKSRIAYYAFGESDPLVSTPDGQRNSDNRRVEISIE